MNNITQKTFLSLLFLCCSYFAGAQSFDEYKKLLLEEYRGYKGKVELEYREYRDKINREYAEFMREAWTRHDVKPAEPVPERPEPPVPVVKEPGREIEPIKKPLPFSGLVPTPAPKPLVRPEIPVKPVLPDERNFEFVYYGTECDVPYDEKLRFSLADISEDKVADAWTALSNDESTVLIASCLDWRDELELCDWGYVRFVEEMTMAFYGDKMTNEARLMQMYVLTQSGYKMRMARADDSLIMLLPSDNRIWQYPYLNVGSQRYYIIDQNAKNWAGIYLFDHEFPKEQMLSLQITGIPELEYSYTDGKTFSSKRFPGISVNISVNKNLMDFYNDYPLSNDWDIYARASLSSYAKEQLYPMLKESIRGLGELEAAERLLNFAQTAFQYMTDGEQFGFEKPFFADELFGYPYCDCEDRSILFAGLVHDLLGLDVVLVNYPGHMATAVKFNDHVQGAYFEIDSDKYIICDPTYIGASVGDAMPQFENSSANIINLW